jgi:nucleoside phosphorylase
MDVPPQLQESGVSRVARPYRAQPAHGKQGSRHNGAPTHHHYQKRAHTQQAAANHDVCAAAGIDRPGSAATRLLHAAVLGEQFAVTQLKVL